MSIPRWSIQPVGVLANQALNYLVSGNVPKRIGNAHPNIVPYQVFPVADGHIIIATGNDNQFAKLCAVLGEPELAKEPAYKDNKARLANRAELVARISALTARMSARELLAKLEAVRRAGRPDQRSRSGVFRSAGDPSRHAARAAERRTPKAEKFPACARRSCSTATPMAAERPSPRLGEHTAEILREIGEG